MLDINLLRRDHDGVVARLETRKNPSPTSTWSASARSRPTARRSRPAPKRVPAFTAHRLNAGLRPIDDVESRYYLRLTVEDRSGVVAKVATVLGDADISIASVLQREAPEPKPGEKPSAHVPLIFMLHTARDKAVRDAVARIDRLDVVKDKTVLIRVETFD